MSSVHCQYIVKLTEQFFCYLLSRMIFNMMENAMGLHANPTTSTWWRSITDSNPSTVNMPLKKPRTVAKCTLYFFHGFPNYTMK